jgi:hypothetical protein
MVPGLGSLAEVLPPDLVAGFGRAAAGEVPVVWTSASGRAHTFTVAPPPAEESPLEVSPVVSAAPAPGDSQASDADDLLPIAAAPAFTRASDLAGDASLGVAMVAGGVESDRLAGTIVHRLMQRLGFMGDRPKDEVARQALAALRSGEAAGLDHPAAFASRVADLYFSLCGHPLVQRYYGAPDLLHEVPFTALEDGVIVRGSLDCLVRTTADDLIVLEFKTGRPRPEHRAQVDVYVRVAARLFPGARVRSELIYADLGAVPEAD